MTLISNDPNMIASLIHQINDEANHVTCCLPCHFAYEERRVFPFLPPEEQVKWKAEHELLKANKYPEDAVFLHSVQEMAVFSQYCPEWLIKRINADHLKYYIEKGFVKVDNCEISEVCNNVDV